MKICPLEESLTKVITKLVLFLVNLEMLRPWSGNEANGPMNQISHCVVCSTRDATCRRQPGFSSLSVFAEEDFSHHDHHRNHIVWQDQKWPCQEIAGASKACHIFFRAGNLKVLWGHTATCNEAFSYRQNLTETKTQRGIFDTATSYFVHHTGKGAMFFLQYFLNQ